MKDREHMEEVIRELVAKVAEVAQADSNGIEADLRLKVLVPRAASGGIIGKGGANVKEIRERTNAKISIADTCGSGPGSDQLISISGTEEALHIVLTEVSKQVQALTEEPWFATWVRTNSATSGSSGYGGILTSTGGPPGGNHSYGDYSRTTGVDTLTRVAHSLPPYVMEDSRGFALSCVVPQRLVGGLIGRAGSGIKEVQNLTGTRIGIRDIPDDPDNCSMNIAGPLANTCAAYMLMMRRYIDAEYQASEGR
mmetsp:Transcript_110853/g.320396  ORF Transcript_110853/g.320396 Transcript_110853/m.320396 type:complete len:253 (-) Transcript_110853:194-952(-)